MKDKIDALGTSLQDLVSSFVTVCESSPNYPKTEIRSFIKAYEQLYFYQKSNNFGPWFTSSL